MTFYTTPNTLPRIPFIVSHGGTPRAAEALAEEQRHGEVKLALENGRLLLQYHTENPEPRTVYRS